MTKRIIAPLAIALAAALPFAAPAAAQGVFIGPATNSVSTAPLRGMHANVAQQLPIYGFPNVDVRRLSNSQVAHINYLLHSNNSRGNIRGQIGTTLRGGGLRSLFN